MNQTIELLKKERQQLVSRLKRTGKLINLHIDLARENEKRAKQLTDEIFEIEQAIEQIKSPTH